MLTPEQKTDALIQILYQTACFLKAQMEQHFGCGRKSLRPERVQQVGKQIGR